jgi:hypothetical protein
MKRTAVFAGCSLGFTCAALGQGVPPDYDFDWAVIDKPGNAGWGGEINNYGEGYIGRQVAPI